MQTGRRSLLKLGAAAAAVLAVGGGALALLQPGLADARLTGASREVFTAVARAVVDGTLPAEAVGRDKAIASLLDRIDTLVAGFPAHAQSELSQLLALLASTPGRRGFAGLSQPWASAELAQVQAALQSMRMSSLALRQQAYLALHEITCGAYFSEPATWARLGYPGPVAI